MTAAHRYPGPELRGTYLRRSPTRWKLDHFIRAVTTGARIESDFEEWPTCALLLAEDAARRSHLTRAPIIINLGC